MFFLIFVCYIFEISTLSAKPHSFVSPETLHIKRFFATKPKPNIYANPMNHVILSRVLNTQNVRKDFLESCMPETKIQAFLDSKSNFQIAESISDPMIRDIRTAHTLYRSSNDSIESNIMRYLCLNEQGQMIDVEVSCSPYWARDLTMEEFIPSFVKRIIKQSNPDAHAFYGLGLTRDTLFSTDPRGVFLRSDSLLLPDSRKVFFKEYKLFQSYKEPAAIMQNKWLQFLSDAPHLSEEKAQRRFRKDPFILQAFELCKISTLPKDIESEYKRLERYYSVPSALLNHYLKHGRSKDRN